MSENPPDALARDDLEENPDDFAGEEVTPEHSLDVSSFADESEAEALEVATDE